MSARTSFAITIVLGLVLAMAPAALLAQPLADRVPDDAILYFGWRGSQSMGPRYEQSHLKAVLDDSNLPAVFNEMLPKLFERIGQEEEEANEVFALISAIGGPMWRHPSAIYFGGIDLSNPDEPMPKVAILCDAGNEAEALLAQVNEALAQSNTPIPFTATAYGSLVAVTIGRDAGFDALLGGPGGNAPSPVLAKNAQFTAALKQAHDDPAFALYLNTEKAMGLANIATAGDPEAARIWPIIRDAAGLSGVKQFIYTGGFDEKEWRESVFIDAPAPRKGVIAAMADHEPITDAALKLVPKSASFMGAARFDPATFLDALRAMIEKVDSNSAAEFDGGMNQAREMLGADIRDDLLVPLGSEWLIYAAPDVGGNGLLGITAVNKLDDAAKFEQTLTSLEQLANQIIEQQMQGEDVIIRMRSGEYEGTTVHWLTIPGIAPAWAVRDGNLYVALYPQVVVAAAEHVAGKGASILENEKFTAVQKRLGDKRGSGLSFIDLQATADDGYQMMLLLQQLAMGAADMFGVGSPVMVAPPLNRLLPHLTPAGSVNWADDTGLHVHWLKPFPAAEFVATEQNVLIGYQAMMFGVMVPAMNRAREAANRAQCASNMRQIGQGCMLYATENNGKYPADIGELMKRQRFLRADVFVCPSVGGAPSDVKQMNRDQLAQWVNENTHYTYIPRKTNIAVADQIVLYEDVSHHDFDGMNMLFGDGHVEFVPQWRAEEMIAKLQGDAIEEQNLEQQQLP